MTNQEVNRCKYCDRRVSKNEKFCSHICYKEWTKSVKEKES